MLKGDRFSARLAAGVAFAAISAATPAAATEGYFQAGYGTLQKAMAGAGVANPGDAMALSINPAGLVDLPQMITGGVSAFMPYRGYSTTGQFGLVAPGPLFQGGTVDSSNNLFLMPNVAYSSPIDADTAWGAAMFGNGGMNTTYNNVFNANPAVAGCTGVFCGGNAGVDLKQAFITIGFAKRFGTLSVGIAPVLAAQMFSAKGLSLFGFPPAMFFPLPGTMPTYSANPWNLTNNGMSMSFGGGARLGVEWKALPTLRLAVSGQTPLIMTAFSKYAGLFANGGKFDIPANITAGVAWDVIPSVTLMAEYKHIFYSGVSSIANSGSRLVVPYAPLFFGPPAFGGIPYATAIGAGGLLGSPNGPGFGWHDVDVWTIGAEWRVLPNFALRAGFAHNTNPVRWTDVTFNILAPGIVTDHISGGFGWKITPQSSLDFALTYVPKHTVSGPQMTPFGFNPTNVITLGMRQLEVSLGYSYAFGPAPTAVVAKY